MRPHPLALLLSVGCVDEAETCLVPTTPDATSPYTSGPHAVSSSTLKVDVSSRLRDRPMDVYLPQITEEPPPLVIFHHGFAAPRALYHRTACHLAGWGFATVFPQWDESFIVNQDHSELREDSLALLPALEALSAPGGALEAAYDLDRVGVAGHSRGGKQALFHALDEPRLQAVFAIDPVDSGSPFGANNPDKFPLVADSLAELTTPTGMVGAGRGPEILEGGAISAACAPAEGNFSVLFEAASAPTLLWTLPEAGHSDFADPCAEDPEACAPCVAGDDPARAREINAALAVSFFKLHLEGDSGQDYWLTGEGLPDEVVLDAL